MYTWFCRILFSDVRNSETCRFSLTTGNPESLEGTLAEAPTRNLDAALRATFNISLVCALFLLPCSCSVRRRPLQAWTL